MSSANEVKGIIARTYENGLPVILRLVDELPPASVRKQFQWLTVISWTYDGSDNNGMPEDPTNKSMIALEDAIRVNVESKGLCTHAYSKTGNGLKELVYYVADRDHFMAALNDALKAQPQYPIEIEFYADAEWTEFQQLLAKIKRTE